MIAANPAAGPQINQLPAPLLGKRILVVEDDYALAMDLCRGLADLGATVLGPAPTPFYALSMLGRRGADAAVLDVRLYGTDVFDVAEALAARNIPIVFATAWSADDLPLPYRHYPVLQKPIDYEELHSTLGKALFAADVQRPEPPAVPRGAAEDRLMRAIARALRSS